MNEIEQGTDAWKALRCGKITASRVADVIAKTKTGYSASRENYMAQLVCERMTNSVAESFSNAAMAHGTEMEPIARAEYETRFDVMVDQVAFVDHPKIQMTGASPDGLIGSDGLIEIKAPQTNTHIETLLSQTVPGKYFTQMQWQMACTGRQWCDFVSFDPRMGDGLQLFVKRVPRDNAYIQMLEEEVKKFLVELDNKITKLNDLKEKHGNNL
jgi:putative phage-type endonuclease